MATAAERWKRELAEWAIPDHILAQAVESPWGFPVELFPADADAGDGGPSRRLALASLPPGGSILDVGCGGGAASLALVPPAGLVVGVDESAAMLDAMRDAARARGVDCVTVQARWPDGADAAPIADVVVCHHVAYNAPDLAAFAVALTGHARRRVVMELAERHPLTATAPLWRHFHGLERPSGPDASLAREVLAEAGIDAACERWARPPRNVPREAFVAMQRRRLCLPPEREPEVDRLVEPEPDLHQRRLVTLWWDAPPS
ncbi:MAG: class I SAM-dependent methyltransferase [Acidimicrobiaceae bacterium]|nr:class I SAM-dependent methyltransferase [Acidimicrobiaceae bacterium]